MDFSNVPAFNPTLKYQFAFHFGTLAVDGETYVYHVRTFQHVIPDAETYLRLVAFLTTDDFADLEDPERNPAMAFQYQMEGHYGDHGVGDSGVDHEFMRFENNDIDAEEDQMTLIGEWRSWFERHGFPCGPIEGRCYSEEEYDEAFA